MEDRVSKSEKSIDVQSEEFEQVVPLERLQRLAADFENYKKRIERERLEWSDEYRREWFKALLPVLDDFDHYMAHGEPDPGVRMIHSKLLELLHGMGLEVVPGDENSSFDPEIHEAIVAEAGSEADCPRILEVWNKGYLYKGRLIRPAKVKVGDGA